MPRGPRKHLKRLNAPHHWMLNKMGGKWAPRPSPGPHKLRECLPLLILIRNRLKYALNKREVTYVVMGKHIQVDGRVRTDPNFPAGFMDVITIPKTNEHFRLLYDVKGKFAVVRIKPEDAKFKLCQVRQVRVGKKSIPYIVTHDGRTIRYPDPVIKAGDTIKLNLETGDIEEIVPFDTGNVCMVTGGRNLGRVGILEHRDRHAGSFDMIHMRDERGHHFITRASNVFIIGRGKQPLVTLPSRKGIHQSIIEERDRRLERSQKKKTLADL